MSTITARLPSWLEKELREFWSRHGEGPSAGLRQVAEEWWTLHKFPSLEFREGIAGRRAGIRGGPDVWEIVEVAREVDIDLEALVEHFGGSLAPEAIEDALGYAELFPETVEDWIQENARVAALLGELEVEG